MCGALGFWESQLNREVEAGVVLPNRCTTGGIVNRGFRHWGREWVNQRQMDPDEIEQPIAIQIGEVSGWPPQDSRSLVYGNEVAWVS
jgi:hypothetical protein